MMLGWHLLASWSWPKFWSVLPRLRGCSAQCWTPTALGPCFRSHRGLRTLSQVSWLCAVKNLSWSSEQGKSCRMQITAWAILAPCGNKQYPTLARSSWLASSLPSLMLKYLCKSLSTCKVVKRSANPYKGILLNLSLVEVKNNCPYILIWNHSATLRLHSGMSS